MSNIMSKGVRGRVIRNNSEAQSKSLRNPLMAASGLGRGAVKPPTYKVRTLFLHRARCSLVGGASGLLTPRRLLRPRLLPQRMILAANRGSLHQSFDISHSWTSALRDLRRLSLI